MKYSDHPMQLKEGEYPWEHIRVFDTGTRKWKDQWRQLEEADIKEAEAKKWEGQIPETDTYYLAGKEEYYDFETVCKACGTQFMAYTGEGIETKAIRNFCPGCGKRLAVKDNEPNIIYKSQYPSFMDEPWYFCMKCNKRLALDNAYCPGCGEMKNWSNVIVEQSKKE